MKPSKLYIKKSSIEILNSDFTEPSPLGPWSLRLSGKVEAVGYNHQIEPEKGQQLVSSVRKFLLLLLPEIYQRLTCLIEDRHPSFTFGLKKDLYILGIILNP